MSEKTFENYDFVITSKETQEHLGWDGPYAVVVDASKNLFMVLDFGEKEFEKMVEISAKDLQAFEKSNPNRSGCFLHYYSDVELCFDSLVAPDQTVVPLDDSIVDKWNIYQECSKKHPPTIDDLIYLLNYKELQDKEEFEFFMGHKPSSEK